MSTLGGLRSTDAAVFFHCAPHVLAVGAQYVERLLLREEALDEERSEGSEIARIWIAGRPFAVWDLGLLLGLGPQSAAAVLLRLPWEGGMLGLSLRTGPCTAVKPLPELHALPRAVFAGRPAALPMAFQARDVLGPAEGEAMGYLLDPTSLWTDDELSASAAVAGPLASHRAQGLNDSGRGGAP